MRKYDIVVFGASGFTGKYLLEEIIKTKRIGLSEEFTWAVAGRNATKLDDVLAEISKETGTNISNIDKVIADVNNYDSLLEMARACQIVINTVGPYEFYGENVIKACIQEKTHHVDISAESHNLTRMQIEYSKQAQEKGVYIVGSCGFDSIPVECGINYLNKHFNGQINSVESYLYVGSHLWTNKIHFGTWQSILRFYAQFRKLRPLLRQLYPEKLPEPKYKLSGRLIHRNDLGASGWCIPFPAPDVWAVERSQNYFYIEENRTPIQFVGYLKQSNIFVTLFIAIGSIFIGIMIQFRCGIYLLEKFPRLMSGGIISHAGPTRDQMNAFDFSFTLIGKGWEWNVSEDQNQPPNKTLTVQVRGVNPGYGSTNTCLLHSALTILKESSSMPSTGGVFTPGTAFQNTTIIDRINKHGVEFLVLP